MFNKLSIPPTEDPTPKRLTPQQMGDWNGFVSFLDSKGYKGHTDFDTKDKNLGELAMNTYKKYNPNFSLSYNDIPSVQQGIIDSRNFAINQLKTGKATLADGLDAGKDYEKFMPNVSPADGWLGSKTSSHIFPKAYLDEYENGNKVTDKKELGFVQNK